MILRRLIFGFTALAMTLALAACGTTPSTPDIAPTFAPATPQIAPTATTAPTPAPPADTAITFEKTGGIAGIHDKLEINTQAQATYTSGSISRKQTLPITTYGALLQQIETADFFNLKDNYDNGNVADDFYYTITVTQGDRAKTVKVAAAGGEGLITPALQDLIAQLTSIQNTLSSTGTTVTFVTTGGIAGINDTLTVKPDRQVIYTSRNLPGKQTQISADQYNKLLAQIDKADFFNLKDSYGGAVPDAFIYTIAVTELNRTKTVSSSQTSEMPQSLKDLIGQLNEIQNMVR